jgi:hypothetical protein
VPKPPLRHWDLGTRWGNKLESRLVLGKRDAAIQEALDHAGVFIDINPELPDSLQQTSIDPYLVYKKELIMQTKKRIPRIDFVNAVVDALFDDWKGKPNDQAPIHARLILCLKNFAATYGHEQRPLGELLDITRIGRLMNEPVMAPFGDLAREAKELRFISRWHHPD